MAQKTKNGKRFVRAAGVIVLTVATLLGSFGLVAQNKASRISDEEQVETIAKALDCDLSYMKYNETGGVVRMMHNGNEPIYVHITDEMNEEESALIKESLDYVFGIVGSINDNYKYEFVNENKYNKQKILGKTTIKYQEGPCDSGKVDSPGQILRETNYLERFSNNDYYTTHVIEYDREEHKEKDLDQKLYTFIHELLHAFGFDDVYVEGPNKKTNVDHQNTFMKGPSSGGNIITPNDLKCKLSAFAEQMGEDELQLYIEKAKIVVSRYEEFYYKNRVEKLKNYENGQISDLNGVDINSKFSSNLIEVDGSEKHQEVEIQIEGDKYTFKIVGDGRDGECISTGRVIEVDGVKVLKDVKFTGAFELSDAGKVLETVVDLYLTRIGNRDMLYNVQTYGSMIGKNLEVKNELN